MNPRFIASLMTGTLADLREALGNAGECFTTAEDYSTRDHYNREADMIVAIGRYRFPDVWDEADVEPEPALKTTFWTVNENGEAVRE